MIGLDHIDRARRLLDELEQALGRSDPEAAGRAAAGLVLAAHDLRARVRLGLVGGPSA